MKKVVLGILSVFMSVCFVSCESDTESIDEVNKLKEFSFARDEFGNFTLKYDVVEGFSSEEYDNFDSGRKEITFNNVSSDTVSRMSSDLEMVDSQVKVGFLEVDGISDEFISVEDDDITSFQMKQNNPLLKWYEVYRNKKGKYVINFKTKKNVIVDYQYNKRKGENEIWLIRAGEGRVVGKNEHKRNYSYTEGDTLRITFITEIKKGNSKNDSVENLQGYIRKPRIIIKDDRPSDY